MSPSTLLGKAALILLALGLASPTGDVQIINPQSQWPGQDEALIQSLLSFGHPYHPRQQFSEAEQIKMLRATKPSVGTVSGKANEIILNTYNLWAVEKISTAQAGLQILDALQSIQSPSAECEYIVDLVIAMTLLRLWISPNPYPGINLHHPWSKVMAVLARYSNSNNHTGLPDDLRAAWPGPRNIDTLPGITPKLLETLQAAGFQTLDQLMPLTIEELKDIPGLASAQAQMLSTLLQLQIRANRPLSFFLWLEQRPTRLPELVFETKRAIQNRGIVRVTQLRDLSIVELSEFLSPRQVNQVLKAFGSWSYDLRSNPLKPARLRPGVPVAALNLPPEINEVLRVRRIDTVGSLRRFYVSDLIQMGLSRDQVKLIVGAMRKVRLELAGRWSVWTDVPPEMAYQQLFFTPDQLPVSKETVGALNMAQIKTMPELQNRTQEELLSQTRLTRDRLEELMIALKRIGLPLRSQFVLEEHREISRYLPEAA